MASAYFAAAMDDVQTHAACARRPDWSAVNCAVPADRVGDNVEVFNYGIPSRDLRALLVVEARKKPFHSIARRPTPTSWILH